MLRHFSFSPGGCDTNTGPRSGLYGILVGDETRNPPTIKPVGLSGPPVRAFAGPVITGADST